MMEQQQEKSRITDAIELYCKYYQDDVLKRFGRAEKAITLVRDAYCVGLAVGFTCDLIERDKEEMVYQYIICKVKRFLENTKPGSLEEQQLQNLLTDYRGQLYQYYTQQIYKYCIS